MRLDIYLTENKIYGSRTRARRAVEAGCVSVNGMTVMKASYDVTKSDVVSADSDPVPYVSRGAFKLLHGLEMFSVNIDGAVALDVGASTGGFTEVMLKRGAARVYAVDVGRGQLDAGLAADPRVVNMEATDIRSLTGRGFENFFDFTACDASFISLTYILPVCAGLMKEGADRHFPDKAAV